MTLPLASVSPVMDDPGMPESPSGHRFTVGYKQKVLAAARTTLSGFLMPKKFAKRATPQSVETLTYEESKRKNVSTVEYSAMNGGAGSDVKEKGATATATTVVGAATS